MSKSGSYLGGHTVVNGGSGWFSGERVIVKKAKKSKKQKREEQAKRAKFPITAAPLTSLTVDQLKDALVQQKNVLRNQEALLISIRKRIAEIDREIIKRNQK